MKDHISDENIFYSNLIAYMLMFLIIFIALFPYKYVYYFRINQGVFLKLFTLIAFFLWISKITYIKNILWHKNKLNLFLCLFFLNIIISFFRSNVRIVSLNDFLIFLSYLLIFFLITNNIDKKKHFNYFIKLFFITTFIISIYTIIQYYGFDPYLNDFHCLTSTIGQKNWISNYLSMIFPMIFSYFLLEKSKRIKIAYFIVLSIVYATLMICQSRGIWISITLTLIFAIYIIFKFSLFRIIKENRKWLILLMLSFIIITIIYSTDNFLNKSAITVPERAISTFDKEDPSINTRLLMWKTTFEMIKDRPLFGSGIGTFKMNYLNYQAEVLRDNPDYIKYSGKAGEAHNEYLQMWAELGIIGLGIFLSIFFIFYNLILKYLKKENRDKDKIIVFGLFIGISCFLIHSLFTFPLHVPALGSTFFILFSLSITYIDDFNLDTVINKDKIFKKINLKKSKVKIIFIITMFTVMILLINILVIKPYVAELYYFKGMRYNIDKNYTKALPNFQYAVQLDTYNGRILHALGATYFNLGIIDKAEEVWQRTKKYLIDVNTYNNLGLVYSKLGEYKEAEEELKQAIYLDPKFDKAHYNLGYIYFIQEEYDRTIRHWNKILEIKPNFPNKYIVLNNIGKVYEKKKMPEKALEYFAQALQLAPEGSPIIEEIEGEINKIYKSKLEN